jgi:hypothetical protein
MGSSRGCEHQNLSAPICLAGPQGHQRTHATGPAGPVGAREENCIPARFSSASSFVVRSPVGREARAERKALVIEGSLEKSSWVVSTGPFAALRTLRGLAYCRRGKLRAGTVGHPRSETPPAAAPPRPPRPRSVRLGG